MVHASHTRRLRKRKSRGRGLRTTTGCATCRKRHLKCDEAKPFCGPCAKADKTCDYPRPSPALEEDDTIDDSFNTETQQSQLTEPTEPPDIPVSDERPSEPNVLAWSIQNSEPHHEQHPLDQLAAIVAANPYSPVTLHSNHFSPQNALDGTNSINNGPALVYVTPPVFPLWQIDLFDPTSKFSTFVPHLAMRNAGLLNAILALSCRHLSLNPTITTDEQPNPETALQYYYQTLHYVQKAMHYSSYKTSLELLATTLIISTYEMLDDSCKDWERHLEGVFLIQRSQVIHGETGGLKSSIWWAWLCQDVWAAFRERRKTLTFWTPKKPYASLSPYELASRSVYITAKVINYCSREECAAAEGNIQARFDKAKQLRDMLDEWRSYLTVEFCPLPAMTDESSVFRPIWIRPPAVGVAVQLHCAARILLSIHEPCLGGLDRYQERQAMIKRCVENMCGIAMTLKDGASSLMSSQCLFIAGMFTHDTRAREKVLELIDLCRQRTGWPVNPLGDELKQLWATHETPKDAGQTGSLQHLYP